MGSWLNDIRKKSNNKIQGFSLTKWLKIGIAAFIAFFVIKNCFFQSGDNDKITIEPTPISIEDVKLKGEIYVCSALLEDYATMRKTQMGTFLLPQEHSCVQTLRQKCSYKIELDSIQYFPIKDSKEIAVRLPEPEYVATTQSSEFISDNEEFWAVALKSTNGMKLMVENQIRQKFDTEENRAKARLYARSAVEMMLDKFGFKAVFDSRIQSSDKELQPKEQGINRLNPFNKEGK